MDNNILSTILNLFSGGNVNNGTNSDQNQQNSAYYGYPKEAYSGQYQGLNGINLENILPLLAGNKGNLSSILSNISSKNPQLASIASLFDKKKEEANPLPNKEILL